MRCAHNFRAETQGADWLNYVPSETAEFSVRRKAKKKTSEYERFNVYWLTETMTNNGTKSKIKMQMHHVEKAQN